MKLIDPNYANKVLLKVARILIYMDGLLSIRANCAQTVVSCHIPGRSIGPRATAAGSQRAEIDPTCLRQQSVTQGTRILVCIDGLQYAQTGEAVVYLLHIERSITPE
jgi:hypothetical protein